MRLPNRSFMLLLIVPLLIVVGCDPLAPYAPTPVAIVITSEPTLTVEPTIIPTATLTRTPLPTSTPDFTPTPTAFPCESDSGEVIDITDNRSPTAGENLRYRVYIPPCYRETQKRFPLLVLLHGLSYREQQWEDLGLIDALDQGIRLGVAAPMVVVMPYMGQIGQNNRFPPDPSYETVILDELLPAMQRDFCIWESPDYRAIGGISRGGFWAFSIAMRHPDIFGIVGGHSAYFPNTNDIPPAFNPLELALNSSFLEEDTLRMYLDNGASDSSGPSQSLFSSRLTERGISHRYIIHPTGEHNNEYWSAHVSEYVLYYSETWPKSYDALPSCLEPSP